MKEGLTFATLLGFDDIQKQFQLVFDRQKETIQLLMNGNYGIISTINTNESTSSIYPTIDSGKLKFTSGNAITVNGDIVYIDSFSVTLPSISEDTIACFVYEQIGSSEKRVTNDGNAKSVWYEQRDEESSLKFFTQSQYASLTSDVKNSSIVLCILKSTTSGIELDVTQSTYSYNRPWFSPCDISHRQELGTGSSDVPHSIGINDLTSSELTLYTQLISRGIIVSKDVGIPGVPGKLYKYEGGIVTSNATYGSVIELTCYPNAIGSAFLESTNKDVACHLIKGTNLVVIDTGASFGDSITLQLVITDCLMPPIIASSMEELSFGSASSTDVIITQGMQTNISDSTISFSDCGTVPRNYEVVIDSEGAMQKEPSIVGYSTNIDGLVNSYNQDFDIPSQIQIALNGVSIPSSSSDTSITFSVVGLDTSGNIISEELTFNDDNYTNNENSDTEVPDSMQRTENYFSTLTSITVTNQDNLNGNCIVYALSNRALDRRTRVALISWDGDSITSLKDIRPISTTIIDPFKVNTVKESGMSLLNGLNIEDSVQNHLLFVDDFRNPEYLDTRSVNWRTNPYGINFPLIDYSVFDSSSYSDCYRSRVLSPVNPYYEGYQDIAVYLIGSDDLTNNYDSVRIVYSGSTETRFERLMVSKGNGLFLARLSSPADKIQFVVSGKASGIIAIMLSSDKLSGYEV